jgi:hypothetical protein
MVDEIKKDGKTLQRGGVVTPINKESELPYTMYFDKESGFSVAASFLYMTTNKTIASGFPLSIRKVVPSRNVKLTPWRGLFLY